MSSQMPGVETEKEKTNADVLSTTTARFKNDRLPPLKYRYDWIHIVILFYMHISALYGLYFVVLEGFKIQTFIYTIIVMEGSLLGVSAGAHRLWSHRSYKAKLPLRIVYGVLQTVAFQESLYVWIRNHRLHHKYSDDDADPHNPKRGYFFAHIGWVMVQRHPRSVEKGRKLDLSDILTDPVVHFQNKHYLSLAVVLAFIIPVSGPVYLWGESFWTSWYMNILRWTICVHCVFAINSIAHAHGNRPYDNRIGPSDNWVFSSITLGEGCHNYHHVFPWDYRSIEMDTFYFNFTTWFIDLMAKIGWAYDLKSATPEMVDNRAAKTGNAADRPLKYTETLNQFN